MMLDFLPSNDFNSSPPVKHIHSRLSLTVRPFFTKLFTKLFTNWSTKFTEGHQDDDDAEEEEDNAGPVHSLTSLVSLITMSRAHCSLWCLPSSSKLHTACDSI